MEQLDNIAIESQLLTAWSFYDKHKMKNDHVVKEVKMLSSVSETAIYTLNARVKSYKNDEGLIVDSVGAKMYDRLVASMDEADKRRIGMKKLPASLQNYIVLRALKYDLAATEFLDTHPNGLIVSLGCGLDTRYWRIDLKPNQYIELDLPEMIAVKKELYGSDLPYRTIPQSVLDLSWIDEVEKVQNRNVLFLAEGLFMYLPELEVKNLFYEIASRFDQSDLMFEIVSKKYTRGLYKKMVERKMKRRLGSDAGSSFNYGVVDAAEVEAYHAKLKVIEEWSYIQDERVRPKVLKIFKNAKTFTRSQWTMTFKIGESDEEAI